MSKTNVSGTRDDRGGIVVRDFLNESEKAAVESGRCEVYSTDEKRLVSLDERVSKRTGQRLEVRKVELPAYWAGKPPFRHLRDMLFVILPVEHERLPDGGFGIMASLSEAGYCAIDIDPGQDAVTVLDRTYKKNKALFDASKALLVVGDGVKDRALEDGIKDWGKHLEPRVSFVDLLRSHREGMSDKEKIEAFKDKMPTTSPANFAEDGDFLQKLCGRLIERCSADANENAGLMFAKEEERQEITEEAIGLAPAKSLNSDLSMPREKEKLSVGLDKLAGGFLATLTKQVLSTQTLLQQLKECGLLYVIDNATLLLPRFAARPRLVYVMYKFVEYQVVQGW